MNCSLPEYKGEDPESCLHLLITLTADSNRERLRSVLGGSEYCRMVRAFGPDGLIFQAKQEVDVDQCIKAVSSMLDSFNQEAGGAASELSEVRMCRPPSSSTKEFFQLSSRFRVFFQQGDALGSDELVVENGRSFGSGEHPSTRLSVRAMEYLSERLCFPENVLDIGCGSGILSIIAVKLGAGNVRGIDIDKEAVKSAKRNIKLNHITGAVTIEQCFLTDIKGSFDLIIANISPSVLIGLIPELASYLAVNGKIILAGMQSGQVEDICRHLSEAGIEGDQKIFRDGPWQAVLIG